MNKNNQYTTEDLLDEAGLWFARFESGRATSEDRKKFEDWVNASPENLAAFEEIQQLSLNMALLSNDMKSGHLDHSSELGAAVMETAALAKAYQKKKKNTTLRRSFGAIAASIVIALCGSWLWNNPIVMNKEMTYASAVGKQKTVMLSDGSVVTLNTNSEITVAMTSSIRRLHLIKGEVYFEVAKDQQRPFEVKVNNAFVKAVGTAFNIRNRGNEVSVIVTEGKVEIDPNYASRSPMSSTDPSARQKQMMIAGDQIILGKEKLTRIQLDQDDISEKILWREGKVILNEATLEAIVYEIQPYITEKIIIADDDVAGLIAGGVFQMGEMDSFFSALEIALPVKIIRKKGVIILTRLHTTGA